MSGYAQLMRPGEKLEYYTVEDVAEKLHLSVATVRRKCSQGYWGAKKVGRQWLIPAKSFDELKKPPARKKKTPKVRYDFSLAFRHVQSTDLSDTWVPDVVRFRDWLENGNVPVMQAEERVERGSFGPAHRLHVPKTLYASRPGVLLGLPDRIAYQAVVGSFTEKIYTDLVDKVFSCRLSANRKYFLEHGSKRFARFEQTLKDKSSKGEGWVVKTDITSYFDHIVHRILIEDLKAKGVPGETLAHLQYMLRKWSLLEGIGIPQGPNASRVLGNFYMFPVDHEMIDSGIDYYRYMDDIGIIADTKSDAASALRKLETLCRNRGLTLSSAKTQIMSTSDFVKSVNEDKINEVAYIFDSGDLPRARSELRSMLKSALSAKGLSIKKLRFSMWRLAQIREASVRGRVLDNLEYLAPVASVVAAYLMHFVDRPATQKKITDFLCDDTRSYSVHLKTWLFAAMLEVRDVPSDWRKIAFDHASDRNLPSYLRVIAACLMAKRRENRDIKWLKSQLEIEHDPVIARGYIVALKYAGALDKNPSLGVGLYENLQPTIEWIRTRTSLPSLVYSDRSITLSVS